MEQCDTNLDVTKMEDFYIGTKVRTRVYIYIYILLPSLNLIYYFSSRIYIHTLLRSIVENILCHVCKSNLIKV